MEKLSISCNGSVSTSTCASLHHALGQPIGDGFFPTDFDFCTQIVPVVSNEEEEEEEEEAAALEEKKAVVKEQQNTNTVPREAIVHKRAVKRQKSMNPYPAPLNQHYRRPSRTRSSRKPSFKVDAWHEEEDEEQSVCSYDIPHLGPTAQHNGGGSSRDLFSDFARSRADKMLLSSTPTAFNSIKMPRTFSMRMDVGLKGSNTNTLKSGDYNLKRNKSLMTNFTYVREENSDDEECLEEEGSVCSIGSDKSATKKNHSFRLSTFSSEVDGSKHSGVTLSSDENGFIEIENEERPVMSKPVVNQNVETNHKDINKDESRDDFIMVSRPCTCLYLQRNSSDFLSLTD